MHLVGLKRFSDSSAFSWVDGTPLDFTLWKDGEPNEPEKFCTRLESSGEWIDTDCDKFRSFPCEKGEQSLHLIVLFSRNHGVCSFCHDFDP